MKIKNLLILLLLFISSISFAQSEFLNTFGFPFPVAETTFNDVSFHSATNSYFAVGNINTRGIITRLNADGDQMWTRILIEEGSFFSVTFNPVNHEIMAVGLDESQTPSRVIYVRIAANGTLLSTPKYYEVPNSQRVVRPKIILSTASPASYLIGFSNVPSDATSAFSDNLILMRINANGDIFWRQQYYTHRTLNDDQIYDFVSNGSGGCSYTGFTSQQSNHSYIGEIDINGNPLNAFRIQTNRPFTRFLSIDRIGGRVILGGETAGDYTGRGIVSLINTAVGNAGWIREYSSQGTTVTDVAVNSNNILAKRSGVNGTSTMDLMLLTTGGATNGGLRYNDISNNFFAGIEGLSDGRALVYNTSSNLPVTIGGLDNFVNVINTTNLSESTTCISEVIESQALALPYSLGKVSMRHGDVDIRVTELIKTAGFQLTQEEVCCSCDQVTACFTTCNLSCLSCANVFLNCSEPSSCGNFESVTSPYLWEVTNVNTGVVMYTSTEKDFLFLPPGNTNALFNICLTVTDSEGCTNTYCEEKSYVCNNNLTEEEGEEKQEEDFGVVPEKYSPEIFYANELPEEVINSTRSFQLQPNPAHKEVTLLWKESELLGSTVMVFNAAGQLKINEKINAGYMTTLDIHPLPTGIYVVKVFKDGKSLGEQKLVVSH